MLAAPDDNYCRGCGAFLGAQRMPVVVEPTKPSLRGNGHVRVPGPARQVATAVAIGAALQLGLGLAGKAWAMGRAARRAQSFVSTWRGRARPAEKGAGRRFEVTEMVIFRRWHAGEDD